MNELMKWLDANKITYRVIDNEVVEIEDFGKMFYAELGGLSSIFRTEKDNICFNLMENPQVLMDEGIYYVAFPFGDNFYYYDLREEFRFNILKYIGKRQPCQCRKPFVNLGVHTPYELLSGAGDLSLWISKAKYVGHTAIGICDYNTMAATLNLQKACEKEGITPVFGYTFRLRAGDDEVEMKIYCQSQQGFRGLLRIQKEIMVDSPQQVLSLQGLISNLPGNVLVVGTLHSRWMERNPVIMSKIFKAADRIFYQVDLSEYKADRIDSEVLDAVGFYFHHFYRPENDTFIVEPILICDCYYPDKDDARSRIILNKVASGAAHRQSQDQYFKDADEHLATLRPLFSSDWDLDALFARMCRHTVEVAEGAKARYETQRTFMPRYKMTADEKKRYGNSHRMFLELLEEGFRRLVPHGKEKVYRERLDKEIYVLESTDSVEYLLVQFDTVNWARRQGILVGAGRGSAGGSLALYLLGITLIDPILYDLLFERFLLPERAGLYASPATKFMGEIKSTNYVEILLENGRTMRFDKDARLLVTRDDEIIQVYADELLEGDDILFDNRDLLFVIEPH